MTCHVLLCVCCVCTMCCCVCFYCCVYYVPVGAVSAVVGVAASATVARSDRTRQNGKQARGHRCRRKHVSDCSNSHKISSASRQSFVHDTPCCVKRPSDNRWRHRKLRHRLSKHRLACYVLLCVLCVQYVLLCALLHVLCAGRRGLRCRRGRRYRRGRQIVD